MILCYCHTCPYDLKIERRLFLEKMLFFFFLQIYVTSPNNKTCLLEQPILSIILQKIQHSYKVLHTSIT
jgi:hypothetical protein